MSTFAPPAPDLNELFAACQAWESGEGNPGRSLGGLTDAGRPSRREPLVVDRSVLAGS